MTQWLQSLFDQRAWANRRMLDSLAACPAAQVEGTPLLAHLLAAEHIWLSRLQHREAILPVWPTLALPECRKLLDECEEGWAAYLHGLRPEELRHEIAYKTTRGDTCRTMALDILLHVAVHGGYHRGQIARIIVRSGGEVASTDYIIYARTANSAGPAQAVERTGDEQ